MDLIKAIVLLLFATNCYAQNIGGEVSNPSGATAESLGLIDLSDVNSSTATAGRLLVSNGVAWDSLDNLSSGYVKMNTTNANGYLNLSQIGTNAFDNGDSLLYVYLQNINNNTTGRAAFFRDEWTPVSNTANDFYGENFYNLFDGVTNGINHTGSAYGITNYFNYQILGTGLYVNSLYNYLNLLSLGQIANSVNMDLFTQCDTACDVATNKGLRIRSDFSGGSIGDDIAISQETATARNSFAGPITTTNTISMTNAGTTSQPFYISDNPPADGVSTAYGVETTMPNDTVSTIHQGVHVSMDAGSANNLGVPFYLTVNDSASVNTAGIYPEALLIDGNLGAVGEMTAAIRVNPTGLNNSFTTGLDVSATKINNAIDIGANNFKTSAKTLTSTQLDHLADINSTTVTSGKLLIADGNEFDSKALSGDVTVDGAGVTDVTFINSYTATSGNILIANGSAFDSTAMSGDVTITGGGVTDISFINSSTATSGNILVGNGVAFDSVSYAQTRCGVFVLDGTDNKQMGSFTNATTINSVWCQCEGTCTTAATITLEDVSSNAMTITGTNPTCAANTTTPTPAAVTAGNTLTAYEGFQFDVTNTPSPTTDTYDVCVKYTTNPQ